MRRTEKVLEEMSQARGWRAWRGQEQGAKKNSENGICTHPEITVWSGLAEDAEMMKQILTEKSLKASLREDGILLGDKEVGL